MRGLPLFNFPAFDKAAERLTEDGWVVHSPADHDRSMGFDPEGPRPSAEALAQMHRWDMKTITESDAIYMLPGWEDSDGATRELGVARVCGLEVHLAPDAAVPEGWAEALVTTHEDVEQRLALYGVNGTHWDGAHWVEPPDGEAMEPRPAQVDPPRPPAKSPLTEFFEWIGKWAPTPTEEATEETTVSGHAFNRAVDKTLHRCLSISDQRGGEYQDTWSLDNEVTIFLDATLRAIGIGPGGPGPLAIEPYTPEEKRLLIVASLIDVKLSRMLGPWKQDTIDDAVNYLGAYASWREAYEHPTEDET